MRNSQAIASRSKHLRRNIISALAGLALSFVGTLSFALEHQHTVITLEDLDQIVVKAGSVDGFLESPLIQDEYYHALAQYYGGEHKFSRKSYDAIIEQLRVVNSKVPGFGERLWQTDHLGDPFTITTSVQSSGLDLKKEEWERYLKVHIKALDQNAHSIYEISPQDRSKRIHREVYSLEQKVKDFEQSLVNVPKSERGAKAKRFYQHDLIEDPVFKRVSAYLSSEKLSSQSVQDVLKSGDADLVIQTMRDLRSASGLRSVVNFPISDSLLEQFARAAIPSLELPPLLVKDGKPLENEFFKVRTRVGNRGTVYAAGRSGVSKFTIKPIPRRIHGIWKGIPLGECVGGSDSSLDSLTPERWATIALSESQLYHVEREGDYLGFVQQVPVWNGDKKAISVDFGAPVLRNKTVETDENGIHVRALFDLWLKHSSKTLGPDVSGFVMSDSKAINNAGVMETAWSSPYFILGQSVPASGQFVVRDPMAQEIVKSFERRGMAKKYGGRMIFDAVVPQAVTYTTLNPLTDEELRDRKHVEKLLGHLKDFEEAQAKLKLIQEGPTRTHAETLKQVLSEQIKTLAELEIDKVGIDRLLSANVNETKLWALFQAALENHVRQLPQIISKATENPKDNIPYYLAYRFATTPEGLKYKTALLEFARKNPIFRRDLVQALGDVKDLTPYMDFIDLIVKIESEGRTTGPNEFIRTWMWIKLASNPTMSKRPDLVGKMLKIDAPYPGSGYESAWYFGPDSGSMQQWKTLLEQSHLQGKDFDAFRDSLKIEDHKARSEILKCILDALNKNGI